MINKNAAVELIAHGLTISAYSNGRWVDATLLKFTFFDQWEYECVGDDGKYLMQKHWDAGSDCSKQPGMKMNLYHGKCTTMFGDGNKAKFVCDAQRTLYVEACSESENAGDIYELMSSSTVPFQKDCQIGETESDLATKGSCVGNQWKLTTYGAHDKCAADDVETIMVYAKACKDYPIGDTHSYAASVGCTDTEIITTICASDAKTISSDEELNKFHWLDTIDWKLPAGCQNNQDCDDQGVCTTTSMTVACGNTDLETKRYSAPNCDANHKLDEILMPLNIMMKQAYPPKEIDPNASEYVFKGDCKNGRYHMTMGSVFVAKKRSEMTYVPPSQITQDGDKMMHDNVVVTAVENGKIEVKAKHPDDPQFKATKSDSDSASAGLLVFFGMVASLFVF